MSPAQIIEFFGNEHKAIKALGIVRQTMWCWNKAQYVPMPTQKRIERLTSGLLKVDEVCVTVDEIIQFFGSIDIAAKKLGFRRPTIIGWQKKGAIPFYMQRILLEKMQNHE